MSWKNEYHRALLNVLGRQAYVCEDNPSPYGWVDYDGTQIWREHLKGCSVDPNTSMPREEQWDEFQGTFADDRHVYGVAADVSCACGSYRGVRLYLEATFSSLTLDVLNEPEEIR